jgi:hypothetical protein
MLKVSDMPNNGSAMLAIFCDLSPEDQSQFRPWLLEDMFPARLKIGFRNCASFDLVKGEGPEFVTLYETSSLGHLYDVPYRALRELRTPRDAAYHKKFQNPERYTLAWTGPEITRKTDDFATYIKIDRFNLKNHLIEEFNTWFFSTYISAFVRSVETLSLRRYISVEGSHNYFIVHEIIDPEIPQTNKYLGNKAKFGTNISGVYKKIIQSSP